MKHAGIISGKRFLHLSVAAVLLISMSAGIAADKEKKNIDRKKEQEKEYGQAVFPAEGRIRMEEGTVEAWVSLDYSAKDILLQDESIITPMVFFSLIGRDRIVQEEKTKKDARSEERRVGKEC